MLKVYTDAAYGPTTGDAGLAIRLLADQSLSEQVVYLPAVADNHQAEFQAMLAALQWLEELGYQQEMILLHSDSQVLVRAMEKAYIKDSRYAPFLEEILALLAHFPKAYPQWIPEKSNRAADQLAKSCLKRQSSWTRTSIR